MNLLIIHIRKSGLILSNIYTLCDKLVIFMEVKHALLEKQKQGPEAEANLSSLILSWLGLA